jgi:hypothetical protein
MIRVYVRHYYAVFFLGLALATVYLVASGYRTSTVLLTVGAFTAYMLIMGGALGLWQRRRAKAARGDGFASS